MCGSLDYSYPLSRFECDSQVLDGLVAGGDPGVVDTVESTTQAQRQRQNQVVRSDV